eukprot:1138164-Pelagomonas_calceolata.AAC.4
MAHVSAGSLPCAICWHEALKAAAAAAVLFLSLVSRPGLFCVTLLWWCNRFLKRLSAKAAAGNRELADPLLLVKEGQADSGSSRQWQDSDAVLSLVAEDPLIAKQRSNLQAKLESLQATRSVLSRFA